MADRSRAPHLLSLAALALVATALGWLLLAPHDAGSADGSVAPFAGSGVAGFAGDSGPATEALLDNPTDVAFRQDGAALIADTSNNRVRIVTSNGIINTGAGTGLTGSGPVDNADPTEVDLAAPRGVTAAPGNSYLISDTGNNLVHRVDGANRLTTIAGSGPAGFAGDGGPARAAQLNNPSDTEVAPDGSVLIADTGNNRIRRVAPNGIITTIAGGGSGGDGGPATAAALSAPRDIAVLSDGSVAIADTGNDRIRRVLPDGTIETIAGTGEGFGGDGGPATEAQINAPTSIQPLTNGGFLFADAANNRVRRVTPMGAIFTVMGTGQPGNGGTGGPASQAQLNNPQGITRIPGSGFLVTDTSGAQVRAVSDIGQIPPPEVRRSVAVSPGQPGAVIQPRGSSRAIPLLEDDLVPTGSQFDTTRGAVNMTLNGGTDGFIPATASDGNFALNQSEGAAPTTDLAMNAPLTGCPNAASRSTRRRAGKNRVSRASRSGRRSRRVRTRKRGGRVSISGRRIVTIGQGTDWMVIERCDRALVRVYEGSVVIQDRYRNKTVTIRAGQQYVARRATASETRRPRPTRRSSSSRRRP